MATLSHMGPFIFNPFLFMCLSELVLVGILNKTQLVAIECINFSGQQGQRQRLNSLPLVSCSLRFCDSAQSLALRWPPNAHALSSDMNLLL